MRLLNSWRQKFLENTRAFAMFFFGLGLGYLVIGVCLSHSTHSLAYFVPFCIWALTYAAIGTFYLLRRIRQQAR
jgi:tryptophan-rich sensory protein